MRWSINFGFKFTFETAVSLLLWRCRGRLFHTSRPARLAKPRSRTWFAERPFWFAWNSLPAHHHVEVWRRRRLYLHFEDHAMRAGFTVGCDSNNYNCCCCCYSKLCHHLCRFPVCFHFSFFFPLSAAVSFHFFHFFPLSMPFSRFFPLFPFLSIMPFVTEHIAVCVVGHVKCMGGPARRSLASPDRVWLCYACKPCTVCLVSGRTRKLRLVNTHSATCPRAVL